MNDIIVRDNLTLTDIASNPEAYPEEVVAAGLDVIKFFKSALRDYEQNLSGNIIRRMQHDNATKLPFIDTRGQEKILTIKKGSMKPNSGIKNFEEYIIKSGFAPEQLGEYKFTIFSWKDIKEIRKQGGDVQLLCDELYKEGQSSIVIEEK